MIVNKLKSSYLEGALEKHLVWEYFGRKKEGMFVEVGANDAVAGSQTRLLEQNGWRGVLVEPQSGHQGRGCANCAKARKCFQVGSAAVLGRKAKWICSWVPRTARPRW